MADKKPKKVDLLAAEIIKEARKRKGLTQSKIAKNMGVSFQQFQKMENGRNRISIGALFLICKEIGMTPNYFMRKLSKKLGVDNEIL